MKKTQHEAIVPPSGGVSRRGFLGTVGAGVVGAAVGVDATRGAPESAPAAGSLPRVRLTVNGRPIDLAVEARVTLLDLLRDRIGLTGTKPGCERGECGACTVLVDGVPRYACTTLALEMEGRSITTVEGLMRGEEVGPVQRAFIEEDAFQCGYCTPGQVVAAEGLLRRLPDPTLDQIRQGMCGNLCRCGAYDHIFKAVRRAAALRRSGGMP